MTAGKCARMADAFQAGSAGLVKEALLLAIVLSATSLWGCGSSHHLVNMWEDPNHPLLPMKNILVIDLIKDNAIRRLWEDDFVGALERQGVAAVPSYRLFPDSPPDTMQVAAALRTHLCDGVIVTRRLTDLAKEQFVPGNVDESKNPAASGDTPWLARFYSNYVDFYEPGYTETGKVVRHRTDVWSTRGRGRLVWTATSEVLDPSSGEEVSRYVAGMIVPELVRRRVVLGG